MINPFEGVLPFAFNIKEMRPACVNLQAIYGGTPRLASEFWTKAWQLSPSDDIKLYPVTALMIDRLMVKCEEIHGKD